jgi:DNA primase
MVVEGFFDCMKVSQAGHLCVALRGSSMSEAQQALLCRHFRRVVLLLDGDEAGKAATDECLVQLGRQMWVRAVVLVDGQQPDQLTAEALTNLLGSI